MLSLHITFLIFRAFEQGAIQCPWLRFALFVEQKSANLNRDGYNWRWLTTWGRDSL